MPLSLSDDEYVAVLAAAGPIHPLQRDDFLRTLAAERRWGGPCAPAPAELQRRYVVEARHETSSHATPRHLRAHEAGR
jgi:hypothetical protein